MSLVKSYQKFQIPLAKSSSESQLQLKNRLQGYVIS